MQVRPPTTSVTSGQRLANSPVRGDFGFHCRSGLALPVLLVKARYLMPTVTEATVQIRIAGGTPSPPASWEPRAVSSGVALYGQEGAPLAEQLVSALAKDSLATFVVRANLVAPGIDDATVTFAFNARGFAKVWPQCPAGSKR